MTSQHWTLSEDQKRKLQEHERREASTENAKTEEERIRMAMIKHREAQEAKKRQRELEASVEAVKRKRKIKKMIEAASKRVFEPTTTGDLEGENKKSMQKLNTVGSKA
jgi:hypothetical protein